MNRINKTIYCLAISSLVSSLSYGIEIHNTTPFNFETHIDVVAGFDQYVDLPKYNTTKIPVGAHLVRGILVKGAIGQHAIQPLLEEQKNVLSGTIYYIFCTPVIERKEIPGGYNDLLTKVKFFLVRTPNGALYPGGIVAESKEIELNSSK